MPHRPISVTVKFDTGSLTQMGKRHSPIVRRNLNDTPPRKPKGHDFDYTRQKVAGQMTRHMSHTGG